MVESVLQLKCGCNNYPWGKKGSESRAATLCEKTPGTDFKVDESKNYAGKKNKGEISYNLRSDVI